MLSFLYRLVRAFHREHGYRPNVVIMNHAHYRQLADSLAGISQYSGMTRLLGMEVILSEDCIHPHVAWRTVAARRPLTG